METETISLDDLENLDVGGESSFVVEALKEPAFYTVKDVSAVQTEWGAKVLFRIEDKNGYGCILSNWNFISRERFKALDLKGKRIKLSPIEGNKKKVKLEVA